MHRIWIDGSEFRWSRQRGHFCSGSFFLVQIGQTPRIAAGWGTSAAYLSDEDSLAQWMEESCVTGREEWGVGAPLWKSWTGRPYGKAGRAGPRQTRNRLALGRLSPRRWQRMVTRRTRGRACAAMPVSIYCVTRDSATTSTEQRRTDWTDLHLWSVRERGRTGARTADKGESVQSVQDQCPPGICNAAGRRSRDRWRTGPPRRGRATRTALAHADQSVPRAAARRVSTLYSLARRLAPSSRISSRKSPNASISALRADRPRCSGLRRRVVGLVLPLAAGGD
jgi:hypothetical protein